MSQRARVLWVIVAVILPLVALSGFTIWQQFVRDEFVVSTERTYFAQATAYAAEAFLDGQVMAARALARHPLIARPKPGPELDAVLKEIAADHPDWQAMVLVDADGKMIAAATAGPALDVADRPFFQEAVKTGRPVVSQAIVGRRTGKAIVVIAVPLEPVDGRRGALMVPLATERFASRLLAKIGSPLVDLVVIDAQRQTFIHPDAAKVQKLEKLAGPEVDAVLSGKTGNSIGPFGATSSLVAYAPVASYGWGVLLAEPTVTALAPAHRQVLERAAVLGVILAVVGALGWILAGRLALAFQSAVQARAEAERLSHDLKRAVQARDEFLAAASHDLRNPLAAIQAAGEVLERAVDPGVSKERLESCAQHILSASRRMAAQLDAFLDVSRLEAGRPLELNKRRCDLVPLVRQVVSETQQTTARHRIVLETPPELQAHVDAPRLQRVVGNLLSNAIKYSPDGGDVEVKLDARDTDVLLVVRDRGIGIPGPEQDRVFERFQRASNVAGRFSGTGLGLSGARQIVEQHGGSITVKSQVGKGSLFTVRFPTSLEASRVRAA
jgi:signal transduction histidine kinase